MPRTVTLHIHVVASGGAPSSFETFARFLQVQIEMMPNFWSDLLNSYSLNSKSKKLPKAGK